MKDKSAATIDYDAGSKNTSLATYGDRYYTCKDFNMIIDGVNFGNINEYNIIRKGKKLYLKINNEVLTGKQYERLLRLLRLCATDYTFLIKIDYNLISEKGDQLHKVQNYECKIPDGNILKISNGEVSNLMLKFEIVSIRGQ